MQQESLNNITVAPTDNIAALKTAFAISQPEVTRLVVQADGRAVMPEDNGKSPTQIIPYL